MREFRSLGHLALRMAELAIAQHEMEHLALEKVGQIVEKRAKEKIGEYQQQAGPFQEWQQLSESTLYGGFANGERYPGKIELGYATASDHNPLLRTGAMRDSIEHQVGEGEVQIGSNSDVAVDQELGTRLIPPRSFLSGALAEKTPQVLKIVGESAYLALTRNALPSPAMIEE